MTGIEQGRTSPNRLGSLVRSLAVTGIEPIIQVYLTSYVRRTSIFFLPAPLLSAIKRLAGASIKAGLARDAKDAAFSV
jgi:hypothetical protein